MSFLLCDQFDLQREAIFAIVNAYKNNNFLQHLSTNRDILMRLIELLNAPDPEVVLYSMSILSSAALHCGALDVCTELGMMDVLDEIQYRSGSEEVRRLASGLSDEIFAKQDEEDAAGNNATGFGANSSESEYFDGHPAVIRGVREAVKPAWMSAGTFTGTASSTSNTNTSTYHLHDG